MYFTLQNATGLFLSSLEEHGCTYQNNKADALIIPAEAVADIVQKAESFINSVAPLVLTQVTDVVIKRKLSYKDGYKVDYLCNLDINATPIALFSLDADDASVLDIDMAMPLIAFLRRATNAGGYNAQLV